jgi:hypothetical protein
MQPLEINPRQSRCASILNRGGSSWQGQFNFGFIGLGDDHTYQTISRAYAYKWFKEYMTLANKAEEQILPQLTLP